LLDSLRHGLAATEKERAKQKIACEEKVNGAPHCLDRHLFIAGLLCAQTVASRNTKHCIAAIGSLGSRPKQLLSRSAWFLVKVNPQRALRIRPFTID
jgi:hypothetical protein